MRKWLIRILGGMVGLSLLGLVVNSFLPKPVVVELGAVSRGNLTVSLDEEGKTRLRERYTIEAPLAGTLARLELHPGDVVKTGTVVAQLFPLPSALLDPQARTAAEARLRSARDARRQARAFVERASTALRHAQQELERTRQLAEAGVAARQVLEQAEAEAQTRESELRSARFAEQVGAHEVEFAEAALMGRAKGADESIQLTSPIEGRVLRVERENAGTVVPGTPIVEVGDVQDLEVVAAVLTRDAVALRPGLKAVITRWGGEPSLRGRVRLVEPAAFTKVSPLGVEEQRVNVVIGLDTDSAGREGLGDAYVVDVRFVLSELAGVLRVPASAVFRQGNGWAVFVVRDGRAALGNVELGPSDSLMFELRKGLVEGDKVITHPGELVRDGVRVVAVGPG